MFLFQAMQYLERLEQQRSSNFSNKDSESLRIWISSAEVFNLGEPFGGLEAPDFFEKAIERDHLQLV